jgi:CheY-like chemotaxis protein
MNILIIEDSPMQLKLAHIVLSSAGHNVSETDTAEQVFASIARDRPEVVLVDLVLPGMDGLALVRMLKSDPSTCDIPIVAATSYPEKFSKAAALDAGCDAYLVKPLNTRTLPEQLATLVAHNGKR